MNTGGTGQSAPTPAAPPSSVLSNAVREAWKLRCASVSEEERQKFESCACKGLPDYLQQLEVACKAHRDDSFVFKSLDWFEPLFKLVELFTPSAATAIQAYPNPGALVMGGVMAVLHTTSRLLAFQKLTVQMLSQMGKRSRVLMEYEAQLYQDDTAVQQALIDVYGDIIVFCQKAFSYLTKNGKVKAKVKGLKLILFRDFESQLGVEVQNFESHIEDLELRASLCDKRRLKELRTGQQTDSAQLDQLLTESRDHFQRQEEIYDKFLRIETALREQADRRKKQKEKQKMHQWLSSVSFGLAYDQKCDEHLDGTGSWLMESAQYKSWKSKTSSDLLWIKGKPGCGKSVLAALACTDLKMDLQTNMGLAYAFCRRADQSSQDERVIWGALVRQLSQQQENTNPTLLSEYQRSGRDEQPGGSTLLKILRSILSTNTQTFILIDGLDECMESERLAVNLHALIQNLSDTTLKIIVFSRHDSAFEALFERYEQLQPDQGENESDLQAYISSLFPGASPASVEGQIRDECMKKADGMFLWVKLLAENLPKSLLPSQKLKRVQKVPRGLDSMYDQILEDIWAQEEDVRSTAVLVLIWVTTAFRPLTRNEMLEAAANYEQAKIWDAVERHTNPHYLVSSCMSLVFIDKQGVFRLCHESVRGHLAKGDARPSSALRRYQTQQQDAHVQIARICLKYLLLNDFACGPAHNKGRYNFLRRKYGLLEYCAVHWGRHVLQAGHLDLRDLAMEVILDGPRRALSLQFELYSEDPLMPGQLVNFESSTPIDILAAFGLKAIAESTDAVTIFAPDNSIANGEALSFAVDNQHLDMAFWLLEKSGGLCQLQISDDAKARLVQIMASLGWTDALKIVLQEDNSLVNRKNLGTGITPLRLASQNGMREVIDLLLQYGASINLQDSNGITALTAAVLFEQSETVQYLLLKGADPTVRGILRGSKSMTALHFAAYMGDVVSVATILTNTDWSKQTEAFVEDISPVHLAAEHDRPELMDVLAKAGFPLDSRDFDGRTPLHLAAMSGCHSVVKYLLRAGVARDSKDVSQRTALYRAVLREDLRTVNVLLEGGCDPEIEVIEGGTAVHAALRPAGLAILKRLLAHKSSETVKKMVNRSTDLLMTPLHFAISYGSIDTAKFLLKAGANPLAADDIGWTSLHYAMVSENVGFVCLVLQHMADVDQQNLEGTTALIEAARAGRLANIKEFFDHCSNRGLSSTLNLRKDDGTTAFTAALFNQHEETASFLLDQGADSVKMNDNNFPIHLACWLGYRSIAERLAIIETATTRGYTGRTALFCAAVRGHLSIVKSLNERFPDMIDIPNEKGKSALYAALAAKHFDIVHYLLDHKARCDGTDDVENSLMHIAVSAGNLGVVERLLASGCVGNKRNVRGELPFHIAVRHGRNDIVDLLVAHGLDGTHEVLDSGMTCVMLAAEAGHAEMLQKLAGLGAIFDFADGGGHDAAFWAAFGGYWRLLPLLMDRGVHLFQHTDDGTTPLTAAATAGQADTVQYLVSLRPDLVNLVRWSDDAVPLIEAAKHGNPTTIGVLLASGADGHHPDALGLSALDYAEAHTPSLRAFHRAFNFQSSIQLPNGIEIRHKTIRQTAQTISSLTAEKDAEAIDPLVSIEMFVLLRALILEEDYAAARLCALTVLWPVHQDLHIEVGCSCCDTTDWAGTMYVCKSCLHMTFLCKQCFEDYQRADQNTPVGLQKGLDLEEEVLSLRLVCERDERFSEPEWFTMLLLAMQLFEPVMKWANEKLGQYESWSQEHNATGRYRNLCPMPGQELLQILQDMNWLGDKLYRGIELTPEELDCQEAGLYRFLEHAQHTNPRQDLFSFFCKGHEYMALRYVDLEDERARDDKIDPTTGLLKPSFYSGLVKKYADSSAAQVRLKADEFAKLMSDGLLPQVRFDLDSTSCVRHLHQLKRSYSLTSIGRKKKQLKRRSSFELRSSTKTIGVSFERSVAPLQLDFNHTNSTVNEVAEVSLVETRKTEDNESEPGEALSNNLAAVLPIDTGVEKPSIWRFDTSGACEQQDAVESNKQPALNSHGDADYDSPDRNVADADDHVYTEDNSQHASNSPQALEEPMYNNLSSVQNQNMENDSEAQQLELFKPTYLLDHPGEINIQRFRSWMLAIQIAKATVPEFLDSWFFEKEAELEEARERMVDEARSGRGTSGRGFYDGMSTDSDAEEGRDNNSSSSESES